MAVCRSRDLLTPLLLVLLPALRAALIISAPEKCGGTHVVTHATAFFGPKPGTADVRDVSIFAPRAQVDGAYISARASLRAAPKALPRPLSRRRSRRSLRTLASAFIALAGPARHTSSLGDRIVGESSPGRAAVVSTQAGHPGDEDEDKLTVKTVLTHERPMHTDAKTATSNVPSHAAEGNLGTVDLSTGPSQQGRSDARHEPSTREAPEQLPSTLLVRPEDTISFSLFNACRQLSVPADLDAVKGRVAVVARGVCDFAQKVIFMQDAGAVGVIVVNFKEGGDHLANMKLNDTKKNAEPITIPAVMISYKDWATVLPCRKDTMVVFTAEGEATFDMDYGRDALNWAMMRGMALWILCQCGVNVVRYKRRVSEFRARADAIAALPVETYSRPQPGCSREETPVSQSNTAPVERNCTDASVTEAVPSPSVAGPAPSSPILDHDPEHVGLISASGVDSGGRASPVAHAPAPSSSSTAVEDEVDRREGEDGGDDEEEPVCAICLEEFENGQQVRLLACSHLYHRSCIDPWLQSSSNSCPLCKREVPNLPPPPAQLHYGSMIVQ